MTKKCPSGKINIYGKCIADNKKKYGIIKASPIYKSEGMLPQRIVLRKWQTGTPYVTHTQVWLEDGQTGFEMGHYFKDKSHAEQDYRIRSNQHKRYYG